MRFLSLFIFMFGVSNLWAETDLNPSQKSAEELSAYATNLPLTCSIKECLKSKDVQWKVSDEPTSGIVFYIYSSKNHSDLLVSSLRSCFEESTINTSTGSLPDGSVYFQKFIFEGPKKVKMTFYPPFYKKAENTKAANKDCKQMDISRHGFDLQALNM